MIDSKELRKGNLFLDGNSEITTVESIVENAINYSLDYGDLWTDEEYYFENLQPIPITEEWLLKFGFVIHQSPPVKCFRKGLHFGFFDDDCFYFQLGKGLDIQIKHIHQLQNLYFALTQKELEYVGTNQTRNTRNRQKIPSNG